MECLELIHLNRKYVKLRSQDILAVFIMHRSQVTSSEAIQCGHDLKGQFMQITKDAFCQKP